MPVSFLFFKFLAVYRAVFEQPARPDLPYYLSCPPKLFLERRRVPAKARKCQGRKSILFPVLLMLSCCALCAMADKKNNTPTAPKVLVVMRRPSYALRATAGKELLVPLAAGIHLFPFRTESLSLPALMVLGQMSRESRSVPT